MHTALAGTSFHNAYWSPRVGHQPQGMLANYEYQAPVMHGRDDTFSQLLPGQHFNERYHQANVGRAPIDHTGETYNFDQIPGPQALHTVVVPSEIMQLSALAKSQGAQANAALIASRSQ